MYVLADMEWITDGRGTDWPTQLSAIRVDGAWETTDAFSTLIRPQGPAFRHWNHIAFSGWQPGDFMNAPALYPALDAFGDWIRPDDVVCWWHPEAERQLRLFEKAAQIPDRIAQMLCLNAYVYGFLPHGAAGGPYQLCAANGIPTIRPAHCSDNDVLTLQRLLRGIGFSQEKLQSPPPERAARAENAPDEAPLRYDPESGLLHRSGCELLPKNRELKGFGSFKTPLRRRYKPCACCREAYVRARRARNQSTIERSEFAFVYSARSGIFHRRDCFHILFAADIRGGSYQTCAGTGRRPCRDCRPDLSKDEIVLKPSAPAKKECARAADRTLSREELRAIGRFRQAREERDAALSRGGLTEDERRNMMALTQPGLVFWAGRGYQTFHCRNCAKLAGLGQLQGFRRYQDAVKAGYTPCRQCRPSARQDAKFSIPITNEMRAGESVETLIALCTERCLPFAYDDRYFTMQTMAGKWRIDMELRPVHLEHINLVTDPENTEQFHTQPRLFLSLRDTFDYIIRHDSTLIQSVTAKRAAAQPAAG